MPSGRDAIAARVRGTTVLAEVADVDLVIEAVAEDLDLKLAVLGELGQTVRDDAIITTNTSAISVTRLAAAVPGPERVAGLHFFNPAPLMRLVEVVEAVATGAATMTVLEEFVRRIGKEPAVTKDRPGFLVNRLLMPYLNQVIQDYDDGIADADDLDAALELGLGYPMGPLKLLDLIGLDNHLHATQAAYEQTRDAHYAPPPLLERMVDAGRLGRKSGRGFYEQAAA
jgi:3-hydroxybutyryl-CoA dehydrogenase